MSGARIGLAGFEAAFANNPDPWGTQTRRDEAIKREAVLRALGPTRGRVLELGSGNGSNSVELARRARHLLAADGALTAVALTRAALEGAALEGKGQAVRLRLPEDLEGRAAHGLSHGPLRGPWDAVVVAELLYYLSERDIARLGRAVGRRLRPGARVVLAHHRLRFHDVSSAPALCHDRFLGALGEVRDRRTVRQTRAWRVERCDRV